MRAALALLLLSSTAEAHEFRPAQLWLTGTTTVSARWVIDPARRMTPPRIALADCTPTDSATFECPAPPSRLTVQGLPPSLQVVVLRDGAAPRLLDARRPTLQLGAASHLDFLPLGVVHIALGLDHLLFVAALLLLLRRPGRMVLALTGFTLGHSLTLLAAAGRFELPGPPVEACIALSVLLLAVELARCTPDTLTQRYPVVVATVFGLVHGLGFAGALGELLRGDDLLWPVVAFNLGVELGQLGWVALLLVVGVVTARLGLRPERLRRITAYGVGSLAAFWVIDRISGFWGA